MSRPFPALRAAAVAVAIAVVAAIGAAGSALVGCHRSTPAAAQLTAVKVATVERAGGGGGTRYSAQIAPSTRVDLAFKVGGYVEKIARVADVDGKPRILQEGDSVIAGTELAALRRTDYGQKLGEARAALAQARASAEQATMDLERATKLAASGSIPAAELDTARTRRDSAEASLAGAKVRVDEAQTTLGDTSLRSPIDGVILKRSLEVGALAAPGTVGFSVAAVDNVKAVFGVPDVVLPRVQLGATQTITTAAYPGTEFQGRITRIAPSADAKSRVFEVEVTLGNADGRLKTGMVAALELDQGSAQAPDAPLVPLSAIVRSPSKAGGFAVFVVDDAAGKPLARARDVELGEYLGRVIPVRAGLKEGERIVVQGAGFLSDGEPVEVIP